MYKRQFQNPATDLMGSVVGLHNIILIVMTLVTLFVLFLLFYVSFRFSAKRNPIPSTRTHNTVVEVLWTAIPIVILVVLARTTSITMGIAVHRTSTTVL